MHKSIASAKDVLQLARDRTRFVFDTFDVVQVSFSGGKDSTVCLNLALEEARRRQQVLTVAFFDEECIPPETVEYCERVRELKDVDFRWYCLPVKHRNACSRTSAYWYPWNPDERELWVRKLPAGAITTLPGFNRHSIPQTAGYIWPVKYGNVADIMGIRTQESLSRYRALSGRQGWEAFYGASQHWDHIQNCWPIYDWKSEDVWLAPHELGWDYNRAYDVMNKAGLSLHSQRCAPPFGEQPMKRLWTYKVCWPELWARMAQRVPGAATAARYSETELYGANVQSKAEDITWQELTYQALMKMKPADRRKTASSVRESINQHKRFTSDPIPEDVPHPVSGFCWKDISVIAVVGDLKDRRQVTKVNNKATQRRIKAGVPQSTWGRSTRNEKSPRTS